MKTVAIIQARMGSTRLPGKVLAHISGKPLLWHVVQRTRRAKALDEVMVVTSVKSKDDTVAEFCDKSAIDCFRGSEEDLLDRYYQAAKRFPDSTIVRITADCPLVDPGVADKVIGLYQDGTYDYVSNIFPRTYPDGLDVEAFSLAALERAWLEARDPYDREHVTPYLRKYPKLFRIGNVLHPVDLSGMHWSVDYPEDLEFVRAVYDRMKVTAFGLAELLDLLKEYPELMEINTCRQEEAIPRVVKPILSRREKT